jgi:hypothetical protein
MTVLPPTAMLTVMLTVMVLLIPRCLASFL